MLPPQTLYPHLTYGPFGGFTMARTGHFFFYSSVGFPTGWLHWLVDPLLYLDSVEFPWKKTNTYVCSHYPINSYPVDRC